MTHEVRRVAKQSMQESSATVNSSKSQLLGKTLLKQKTTEPQNNLVGI